MRLLLRHPLWGAITGAWLVVGGVRGEDVTPRLSLQAICQMSPEEVAGEPLVRVAGIVTWTRGSAFTIQDGSGRGLYVNVSLARTRGFFPHHEPPAAPAPGSLVEIEGRLVRGGFGPSPLLPLSISVTGTAPLPDPQPTDTARLFTGADLSRLVAIDAVIQEVTPLNEGTARIWLEADDRRLVAQVERRLIPVDPAALVDADVRIAGVALPTFNTRGEADLTTLQTHRPEWLTILAPARHAPFEIPRIDLGNLDTFRDEPLRGHMTRIEGTVIHATLGKELYLQDGPHGVRIRTSVPDEFVPGDRVEVAGFIDREGRVAGLKHALVRRISTGPPPEPLAVSPDEIIAVNARSAQVAIMADPGDYEHCLVRFPATVVAVTDGGMAAGGSLLATAGQASVIARLPDFGIRGLTGLQPGSEVMLTGVIRTEWPTDGLARRRLPLNQVALDLRTPDDVRLLRLPPWWTPRRVAIVAGIFGGVAAAAVAWAAVLRREVRRQTSIATDEALGRRLAAVEYDVALRERHELAADIHDTVLQTLSGVMFHLRICETLQNRGGSADRSPLANQLAVARQLTNDAASELRGKVCSLRSDRTEDRPFSQLLRELSDRTTADHEARVLLDVDSRIDALPPLVRGNLLLVIQESLHNAVSHGDPRTVAVAVSCDADGGVVVNVRDDGRGFTLAAVPGPDSGHLGLTTMRERIDRLGGGLRIESTPGQGTVVQATMPPGSRSSARPASAEHGAVVRTGGG